MGQKFKYYNASQIVPQGTLLKKFNKVIEYLEEEDLRFTKLYHHKMNVKNTSNISRIIDVFSTKPDAFTKDDFNWVNHYTTADMIISINAHIGFTNINEVYGNGLIFEVFSFTTTPSISKEQFNLYSDGTILSDIVTEL